MANRLYDKGRQGFLDGSIDWDTHNIKVAACGVGYTPDTAVDESLADISDIIATTGNLSGKTVAAGVADANDATLVAVPAGPDVEQLVIYKDSGVAATSWLIALIEVGTGLPFTPNGSDEIIQWANGATKIFKL